MNIYDDEHKILSIFNRKRCLLFFLQRIPNGLEVSLNRFTGVRTIARIEVTDELEIKSTIKCCNGRAKVVAIKDKKIFLINECTQKENTATTKLEKGIYRLRVVGDKTDSTIKVEKNQ